MRNNRDGRRRKRDCAGREEKESSRLQEESYRSSLPYPISSKNAALLENTAATVFNIDIVDLFALAQGQKGVDRLSAYVVEDARESSPEMLKLIAALTETTRSAKIPSRRKNKTSRKKEI